MASFVIHNIAGEVFLNELERSYDISLSDTDRNNFLLGNLIVDSSRINKNIPKDITEDEQKKIKKKIRKSIQEEKISTHFRTKDDLDKCIQAPVVNKFINKYVDYFKEDTSVLGYLFHLYTDKVFFDDLFKLSFKCLDKNNNQTNLIKELNKMQTLKDGKIHSFEEFWSPEGIYNDYTIMNKILLEYYQITFDQDKLLSSIPNFNNPGIEEVDYNNIYSVIKKTSRFISDSYQLENTDLKVFDIDIVKKFIPYVVTNFINNYGELIELSINKNKTKTKNK